MIKAFIECILCERASWMPLEWEYMTLRRVKSSKELDGLERITIRFFCQASSLAFSWVVQLYVQCLCSIFLPLFNGTPFLCSPLTTIWLPVFLCLPGSFWSTSNQAYESADKPKALQWIDRLFGQDSPGGRSSQLVAWLCGHRFQICSLFILAAIDDWILARRFWLQKYLTSRLAGKVTEKAIESDMTFYQYTHQNSIRLSIIF